MILGILLGSVAIIIGGTLLIAIWIERRDRKEMIKRIQETQRIVYIPEIGCVKRPLK